MSNNTSILESLRKRSGLLVAIVGVALMAFVLTGLFSSPDSLFGGNNQYVGEIAGKKIKYEAFKPKVDEAVENQKRSSGKTTLTESETDGIVQQVWNQQINEHVMTKEYEKLGISVSDEELYDLMVEHPHSALVRQLSDPQTGRAVERFADPQTGQLSPVKLREFTQAMTDEEEAQWLQLENYIRQVRTIEKYNNLIKKGLYVTTAATKRNYTAQNTNANIKYVFKNYKLIPDSTIKPTETELHDYYSTHQNEFKQEESRKVEYIAYDIAPSQEDFDNVKKDMEKLAADFKEQKPGEDSAFVVSEADSRFFDMSYNTAGTLSPMIDTTMFKSEVGTVVGPYLENGTYLISKLTGVKNSADSARIRHILVAYAGSGASETKLTKEQAKKLADSLLAAIKGGKGKFTDLVEKYSDDRGKTKPADKKDGEYYMGKGGDYGWVNAKSSFVPAFINAGLDNKKGEVVIAESNYGYHIIEVLDTKGSQKKVQVATIDKKVEPSSKTITAVYAEANKFAGTNTTNELFQKAVVDQKLNKRSPDPIKESDRVVAGLENPKALIRWAYENKKGTVSEPLEFGSKYIVAVITDVKEKGIAPMESVKDALTEKVIRDKKAEMFTKEFNDAMAGGATIDAVASKLKLAVEQAPNVNFNTAAIPGSSNEPAVIGVVSTMKAKAMSKPVKGREGVFVVYVDAVTPAPEQKDMKAQQNMEMSQLAPRVDYEVFDALKDNANISEHIVRYF
ncbi:MAG: parvulin-like peptidyl-prolyl isomerase [Bacteroidetes bacterium]|jgi:peptidyl-prolyl cis-trans isomerase D|nr:parvulin-like peptidyl-prolyl isomerase [Bacteroidota bacterium]